MDKNYKWLQNFINLAEAQLIEIVHAVRFGNEDDVEMAKYLSEHLGEFLNSLDYSPMFMDLDISFTSPMREKLSKISFLSSFVEELRIEEEREFLWGRAGAWRNMNEVCPALYAAMFHDENAQYKKFICKELHEALNAAVHSKRECSEEIGVVREAIKKAFSLWMVSKDEQQMIQAVLLKMHGLSENEIAFELWPDYDWEKSSADTPRQKAYRARQAGLKLMKKYSVT